jgi:hypothetical protein
VSAYIAPPPPHTSTSSPPVLVPVDVSVSHATAGTTTLSELGDRVDGSWNLADTWARQGSDSAEAASWLNMLRHWAGYVSEATRHGPTRVSLGSTRLTRLRRAGLRAMVDGRMGFVYMGCWFHILFFLKLLASHSNTAQGSPGACWCATERPTWANLYGLILTAESRAPTLCRWPREEAGSRSKFLAQVTSTFTKASFGLDRK